MAARGKFPVNHPTLPTDDLHDPLLALYQLKALTFECRLAGHSVGTYAPCVRSKGWRLVVDFGGGGFLGRRLVDIA